MIAVDTHIHLDALEAWEPGDSLGTEDARALVPGIDPAKTRRTLERLGHDRRLSFGAAIHPWWAVAPPASAWAALEALARAPQVGWIGETGLDHLRHADEAERAACEATFRRHLELAHALDKPVIIHCVRAHEDCARILREMRPTRGIVHAFGGSTEQAAAYRRLGYVVGVGCTVTHTRARRVRRVAAQLQDGDFVLETDAPFMAASPRGKGEGRPADLQAVAETVAALRETSVADVWATTSATARAFGLG